MKKMLALLSTIIILSTNLTTLISCDSAVHKTKRRHLKNNDWDEGRWDNSDWDDEKDENDNNKNKDKDPNKDNNNKENEQKNNKPIDPEANEENSVENNKNKEVKNKGIYIVDLEDKQPQILDPQRKWAGTLKDEKARKIFEEKRIERSITTEEDAVIEKFTNALQFKASKNSSDKFNFFMAHKSFVTFKQLVKQIDSFNEQHPKQYLDLPLELFRSFAHDKNAFEEAIVKVYNTVSNFFGKNMGFV